jgi:hypothetical protein
MNIDPQNLPRANEEKRTSNLPRAKEERRAANFYSG